MGDELVVEGGDAGPAGGATGQEETPADSAARPGELEQALAARDREVADLKQARTEAEARLAAAGEALKEAVASYRAVVVQASPGIIAEMVAGESIAAINESLVRAKALVVRVRQGLEAEVARARVPAGAPERGAPDFSGLSPREKIQHGVGRR